MPLPCSSNQLKRYGKLLIEGEIPDEMLDGWSQVLVAFEEYGGQVQALLRGLPHVAQCVMRLKTNTTLRDKLRRLPTHPLARVDDFVGCRVLVPGIIEQREVVTSAVTALEASGHAVTAKDRLWSESQEHRPSFGYRAVHLVAIKEQMRCEVQIRTRLQHTWAEVVERLGDKWGRELRYGEPILQGDELFLGDLTRSGYHKLLLAVSGVIEEYERRALVIEDAEVTLESVRLTARAYEEDEIEVLSQEVESMKVDCRATLDQLGDMLEKLSSIAEEGTA